MINVHWNSEQNSLTKARAHMLKEHVSDTLQQPKDMVASAIIYFAVMKKKLKIDKLIMEEENLQFFNAIVLISPLF